MKGFYVKQIVKLVKQCNDIALLDLVVKILAR